VAPTFGSERVEILDWYQLLPTPVDDRRRCVRSRRRVQHRMKRAGTRWSELGARAILHLRCALLNYDLLKQAA